MPTKETILSYLGPESAKRLANVGVARFENFSELRVRADKPLLVYERGREWAVTDDGRLLDSGAGGLGFADSAIRFYKPSPSELGDMLERISRYSLYAFEEELRMGYITLPGGHRVGVTGQAAAERQGIRTIKHINGLNIRVAHQVKGCADGVLPYLLTGGVRPFCHTMLISPPGCGKTTLLRDIVRQLSDGSPGRWQGFNVGVVDERSEIAGCYRGVPQNDVGCRTDVLDACPKAEGMAMLLRAMAPDVIAVDELGGERDIRAAEDVLNAGVKLLCTAHGRDLDELRRKPATASLMDRQVFERFVVLGAPGKVAGIYDADGKECGRGAV